MSKSILQILKQLNRIEDPLEKRKDKYFRKWSKDKPLRYDDPYYIQYDADNDRSSDIYKKLAPFRKPKDGTYKNNWFKYCMESNIKKGNNFPRYDCERAWDAKGFLQDPRLIQLDKKIQLDPLMYVDDENAVIRNRARELIIGD